MTPVRPPKPGEVSGPARPPKPPAKEQPRAPSTEAQAAATAYNTINLPVFADLHDDEVRRLLEEPALLEALYLAHAPAAQHQANILADLQKEQSRHQDLLQRRQIEADAAYKAARDAVSAARAKEQVWEGQERAMYAALQPTTSDALFTRLQAAWVDADKTSEALLASFLEGAGGKRGAEETQGEVVAFIKEYRHLRRLVHLRAEKLARWKEGRVGGVR